MTWYHPALAQRALDADSREIAALKVENKRLRDAMIEACDLLAERKHWTPARSAGHNARLCLESALANQPQTRSEK